MARRKLKSRASFFEKEEAFFILFLWQERG